MNTKDLVLMMDAEAPEGFQLTLDHKSVPALAVMRYLGEVASYPWPGYEFLQMQSVTAEELARASLFRTDVKLGRLLRDVNPGSTGDLADYKNYNKQVAIREQEIIDGLIKQYPQVLFLINRLQSVILSEYQVERLQPLNKPVTIFNGRVFPILKQE